jgi:peroxiredoxin
LPASTGAPAVGEKAPDFTLPDEEGSTVTLSRLYKPDGSVKGSWVLLVFYRGYW